MVKQNVAVRPNDNPSLSSLTPSSTKTTHIKHVAHCTFDAPTLWLCGPVVAHEIQCILTPRTRCGALCTPALAIAATLSGVDAMRGRENKFIAHAYRILGYVVEWNRSIAVRMFTHALPRISLKYIYIYTWL